MPYHQLKSDDSVRTAILDGKLPERPLTVMAKKWLDDVAWSNITSCWNSPVERLSMLQVIDKLKRKPSTSYYLQANQDEDVSLTQLPQQSSTIISHADECSVIGSSVASDANSVSVGSDYPHAQMQNPPTMDLSSRRGVGSPVSLAPLATFNPYRKDSHEQSGSLPTGYDDGSLPTPSSTQSRMARRFNRIVRRTRTQGELDQVEAPEPPRSASLPYGKAVHPSTAHSQPSPLIANPTFFSEPPSVVISPDLPSGPRRDLTISNGSIISATLDGLMACIVNEGT
jgi:hypothetical protein